MSPRRVICDYCQRDAELVTGRTVYPGRWDLFGLFFWRCEPCGAWVGCHKSDNEGSKHTPLGRLANAELRKAKTRAHAAFDPLWRSGRMSRRDAYQWLAKELGISPANCHIGMFDIDGCRAVVAAVERFNGNGAAAKVRPMSHEAN